MTESRFNVGLITNTALASAARLISGELEALGGASSHRTTTALLNLFSLCESLCLLDEARVLATPTDLRNSLTQHLNRAGILKAFSPSYTRDELRRRLARTPADVRTLSAWRPDGYTHSFWKNYYASFPNLPGDMQPDLGLLGGGAAELDELWKMLRVAGRKMSGDVKGLDASTHVFRGNAYVVIASLERMDFFPDAYRSPYVEAFLGTLYRSFPVELYERVATGMAESVEASDLAAHWPLSIDLPIPSLAAIVLNRARTPAEIPEAIMAVRSEFASYRQNFRQLKQSLNDATTIKQRKKLIGRYRRILSEASGRDAEVVGMTEVLEFSQAVVDTVSAPTNPSSYATALLSLPTRYIASWWRRRPFAAVFRLDAKMPSIERYNELVVKHWGVEASLSFAEQARERADLTEALVRLSRNGRQLTRSAVNRAIQG